MAQAMTSQGNYLRQVREQYENYPYPFRDPKDEAFEFQYAALDDFDCMNYYHFGGRRDFSKGFRALSAGGGTGDAILMLAEQCRDFDAELIYLDISDASMQVAKARAKMRGLSNIAWLHGSLLDAPSLVEGPFDYIESGGVLHHLESPEAGLKALASLLKDDGVIGLMLYARYGRQTIYQLQNLMRILNRGEENMQRRVDYCKSVLKHLPATNGFKYVEPRFSVDIQKFGDIGIYDLFLHSNDVAYSVPELYAYVAGAGLTLTHFFLQDALGNALYRPETYVPDGSLSHVFARLSLEEKQAAAELLHGRIIKHSIYAAKKALPPPSPENLDHVPLLCMLLPRGTNGEIARALEVAEPGEEATLKMYGREVKFAKTPHAALIIAYMNGQRTTREIFQAIRERFGPTEKKPSVEALKKEFLTIFTAFNLHDWMFLRDKSVPGMTFNVPEAQTELARKLGAIA